MAKKLKQVDTGLLKACPKCKSFAFYDWGIELENVTDYPSIAGGRQERYRDWMGHMAVKVCVGCHNPYVIEAGELIAASNVLTGEDIQGLLRMQQGSAAPPRSKDP